VAGELPGKSDSERISRISRKVPNLPRSGSWRAMPASQLKNAFMLFVAAGLELVRRD
jgi:hypothetical protein